MKTISSRRFGSRGGNAVIEFALSATLLFTLLLGTFQFGYTFYVYDQLQSAVRAGTRFASMKAYRTGNDGACTERTLAQVRNMVVYGNPSCPSNGAIPVVKGLTTDKVTVTYGNFDATGKFPGQVTVTVTGFQVDAIFKTFVFTNKPWATVPFFGRSAALECDANCGG